MTTDDPLLGRSDAVPRRHWRWLLPLLVIVAVGVLAASLVVRERGGGTAGPKYALDSYLGALQRGDTTTAFGMLCPSSSAPSKAEFATQVAQERQNFGGVVRHRMGKAKALADGSQIVSYTIQYRNTYRWYEARMTETAGTWRVCGFKEIPRPDVRVPFEPFPAPPSSSDTGSTPTTM